MADFDLVIFDCDGTLTDSEYLNNSALLEVLHEEGLTQYDLDHAYKHWVGNTVASINLSIQRDTGKTLPADIVQRYINKVAALQASALKPIRDADILVAAARGQYKICVASNGERRNVIEALCMTGLLHNFDEAHVFSKSQVKNPKPYPDLFLYAAEQMGAAPGRCLVIEDSATGVRAGIAAGMTVWGFTGAAHDPQKQEETLKSAGAHEVFSRLIHIADKLVP